MDKSKVKKTGSIVINVLLYIFIAICIVVLIATVLAKNNSDGAVEIFGYQMRIVTSNSMSECEYTDVSGYEIGDIPLRSMVFIKTAPDDEAELDEWYRALKVGDVLTFRYVYTTRVTITHRITSITERDTGGFIIELAGDNKSSEFGQMSQVIDTSVPNNTNYVIGKVTGQAYLFGVIMSFLMSPLGIILAIMVPCFVIILLEILKIVRAFTGEKRKLEQKEKEEQENEIEELRRRLAEYEKEEGKSSGQALAETEPSGTTESEDEEI